jgi:hypothetical protein
MFLKLEKNKKKKTLTLTLRPTKAHEAPLSLAPLAAAPRFPPLSQSRAGPTRPPTSSPFPALRRQDRQEPDRSPDAPAPNADRRQDALTPAQPRAARDTERHADPDRTRDPTLRTAPRADARPRRPFFSPRKGASMLPFLLPITSLH